MVKRVINGQTIELVNGAQVHLIGVNSTNTRYELALEELPNTYVTLYDEAYDPVTDIVEGEFSAYVYDQQEECINNLALSGDKKDGNQNEAMLISTSSESNGSSKVQGEGANQTTVNLSELYDRCKEAVFLIVVPTSSTTYSQGSGFFISSDGIAISNFHVFKGGDASNAVVKTIDDKQFRIERIITYNKDQDYIVFKVVTNGSGFPFVNLAVKESKVGEDVFAIGNPQGLEHTLSKGIVSSYRMDHYMIQTTAEITHGSSGGPLFNMNGEVIGITTSGIGEANLNFAMNAVKLDLGSYK